MDSRLIRRTSGKNPRRAAVTIQDVASRLGLTKAAVSKALRGHDDISEGTRARVARAASEMGYIPNYFARSLRAERSGIIGVVVPKISHAFFAGVVSGIQTVAALVGREMMLGVSQEDAAIERRHIDTFLSMRVEALLISVVSEPEPNLITYRNVIDRGVPLVFFDRTPPVLPMPVDCVVMNDRAAAEAAVARAIALGRRRIAHLAGSSRVNIGRERLAGYRSALQAAGIAVAEELIIEGGFSEADGYAGFEQLGRLDALPDAIFCTSFPVALGVVDAMRTLAPDMIGRILLIFFGPDETARFVPTPYICVAQPAEAIGRLAAERALGISAAATGMAPIALHLQENIGTVPDP